MNLYGGKVKALAVIAKQPAIVASGQRAVYAKDAMGRNMVQWLPAVEGRPEGPPSVCLAVDEGKAQVYLTKQEAYHLAVQLVTEADSLPE